MSGKLLLGGAFAALATASAVVSRVFSSSASTPAAALVRPRSVRLLRAAYFPYAIGLSLWCGVVLMGTVSR